MDFKRGEEKLSLFLPSRSLLIMSEESRYAWSHGICPRHSDPIRTENGTTVQKRGTRTSFTFRKVRTGDCECDFPKFCNSRKNKETISESIASGLENLYVHEVNMKFYYIYKTLLLFLTLVLNFEHIFWWFNFEKFILII